MLLYLFELQLMRGLSEGERVAIMRVMQRDKVLRQSSVSSASASANTDGDDSDREVKVRRVTRDKGTTTPVRRRSLRESAFPPISEVPAATTVPNVTKYPENEFETVSLASSTQKQSLGTKVSNASSQSSGKDTDQFNQDLVPRVIVSDEDFETARDLRKSGLDVSEWIRDSESSEDKAMADATSRYGEYVDPEVVPELDTLSDGEREKILEVMRRDTVLRLYTELKVR